MEAEFIFFDLGLTLMGNNHAQLYRRVFSDLGYDVPLEDIELAYHLSNKYFMREKPGTIARMETVPSYLRYMLKLLGHEDISEGFISGIMDLHSCGTWKKYDYTDSVLEYIRCRGIGTGLVTNWDRGCRSILEREDLLKYLDVVVISSEAGVEKPDSAIFDMALSRAGVSASRCLYVGDNYYDDVIGAGRSGIRTLLLNPYDRVGIEELDYGFVAADIRAVRSIL